MNMLLTIFQKIRKSVYMFLYFLDSKVLKRNAEIIVICYHDIGEEGGFSVRLKDFIRQIEYLRTKYCPATLKDLEDHMEGKKKIKSPSFILTFDDGYRGILSTVPYLERNRIKPTVFVISSKVKEKGQNDSYLSLPDLKALMNKGWHIGNHSKSHIPLTGINDLTMREEILSSTQTLSESLGTKIRYFAYPYGRYNGKVTDRLSHNNYDLGLTMDDNTFDKVTNRYQIPRIGINKSHGFSEFKATISPSVIKFRAFAKKIGIGNLFSILMDLKDKSYD